VLQKRGLGLAVVPLCHAQLSLVVRPSETTGRLFQPAQEVNRMNADVQALTPFLLHLVDQATSSGRWAGPSAKTDGTSQSCL